MTRLKGLTLPLAALFLVSLLLAAACGPKATSTPTSGPTSTAATSAPTATATRPAGTTPGATSPVGGQAGTSFAATPTAATTAGAATPTAAPSATGAPAAGTGEAPKGTLTGVVGGLGVGTPSGYPTDCLWCASIVMMSAGESIVTIQRGADGSLAIGPGIADSWQMSEDGKYTDFKIHKGIQFQGGWGEMTTEDMVWTFNAADPAVTKGAAHDTLPNPAIDHVEAVDPYTFRIYWKAFTGSTMFELTDFNEGIPIMSKKVFDQKGADWMRSNVISTGPFQITEWTAQKGIYLKAQAQHWRKVPNIDVFRLLEVPEDSTRLAMLQTGEAQVGDPNLKDWNKLLGAGFKKASEGPVTDWIMMMGGNYWEKNHPVTGDALNRKVNTDLPWVANFDDAAGMERARKVRLALNLDIDRDGINKSILQGLGRPNYLRINLDDPICKENCSKWQFKFDPEQAKQLMKDAGYASGFQLTWWVGPSGIPVEIGQAVAAQWLADLNVKVNFDNRAYSAMRPSLVTRDAGFFQLRDTGLTSPLWPWEWGQSSSVPTGYNDGVEIPEASKVYYAKLKNPPADQVKALTLEFYDYVYQWVTQTAIAEQPAAAIYNPKVITDWPLRPISVTRLSAIRNLEYMKMAQ